MRISQTKRKMIISLFIVSAIAASSVQLLLLQSQRDNSAPPIVSRISETHGTIIITEDDDFKLSSSGVRSGDGTPANPYIISDWEINATLATGISISGTSANFIIRNVTINATAQDYDGILLEGVSNGWIHNVTISNCHSGIAIWSVSSLIKIDESSVSRSFDYGIVIQYGAASYIEITGNRIFANDATGIYLGSTNHFNVISNNVSTDETSSSSRRALQMISSTDGIVTGNNLTAEYKSALYADSCQNVVVASNRMASTLNFGIYLKSCSGFLIYGNSFMGAPQFNDPDWSQAYDDMGDENAWNSSYSTGGNFWVDYTGVDGNSDGIGDTPYIIDGNSRDNYPLTESGPIEPIPEFSTILLPLISMLALLFAVVRRSPDKEF